MRTFLALFALWTIGSTGCALNRSANDPQARMEQMLIDSESLRDGQDEWRRSGWLRDQPDEVTPYRIHGGVGPASSSI